MTQGAVLVVEDDHGLREVLARGLRGEDFDVITAADGAGALNSATTSIAAVVLDIGLPDVDGRDVCLALRGQGVYAPVIFLTARHQVEDRLSGFASGGDDYLTKPFVFAELVARLRAALRRRWRLAPRSGLGTRPCPPTRAIGGRRRDRSEPGNTDYVPGDSSAGVTSAHNFRARPKLIGVHLDLSGAIRRTGATPIAIS